MSRVCHTRTRAVSLVELSDVARTVASMDGTAARSAHTGSTSEGAAHTTATRRRSMLIAAFGTIVEWYDFSVFFYVASILTTEFFGDRGDSLILTLGIGATGFLFRPLGAMVFGHLGDRVGRRAALVISASLIAVSMFGTSVLPGYETVGIWGGVGLVVLRCLAGFSVGAEYTGTMVYLMESARPGRRGFAASWASANSEVGALLAVGLGALAANLLSPEDMQGWGWRILFVVGGILAAMMIPLRGMLEETETTERLKNARPSDGAAGRGSWRESPLVLVLRHQPRAVLVAFLISTIGATSYFLNITYVPTFLAEEAHLAQAGSLGLGTVAAVAAIVVTPFFGLLADKVGRRASLAILVAGLVLTTVPVYALLLGGGSGTGVFSAAFLAVPAAGWSAVAAATIPEQFTAVGRFSGMAIGYNIATVAFGGLSPLVATWLISSTGLSLAPAIYATIVILVAGIPALLLMRSKAHATLAECDEDELLVPV